MERISQARFCELNGLGDGAIYIFGRDHNVFPFFLDKLSCYGVLFLAFLFHTHHRLFYLNDCSLVGLLNAVSRFQEGFSYQYGVA
jgi:hypothetical protein